jgi:DNA-binding MarR family transcriptional regulator
LFPSEKATNEPIENQVLVALRRIIRSIDIHSRNLVKQYGLTVPQLVVLQEISKQGEITSGQIAKAISISQATLTGILDRLEKRGLVERHRSPVDRRKVIAKTTQAADSVLKSGLPLMQTSFVESFRTLQDWEQTMILSSLQRLVNLMHAERLDVAPLLSTEEIDTSLEK